MKAKIKVKKELAKELVMLSKGKFFSVTFRKINGEMRRMNCRLGVSKYLKGGEMRYNAAKRGYIAVYDVVKKGYRLINPNTMTEISVNGLSYELK